ncbi:bifunctional diguanylate cyclase/phosphodiesterase [Aliikangiella sp. IMCC44359]|uniref:bifunctional diguanylate cyclase/phosphodiesterase n=1 Tax=Aliikangiella sp. IMCC44359 TaxID=3459125 RepID=UPI00403AF8EA
MPSISQNDVDTHTRLVTMEANKLNKVQWHKSLQFALTFKALMIFIVAVFTLLLVIIFVIKSVLIESEKQVLYKTGESVVGDIGQITSSAETLTKALASIAEKLPKNTELVKSTILGVIDEPGMENIIAGGGIWPEAYQFDSTQKRNSFFWARDRHNKLRFLNEYNLDKGNGYHHEEWYIPVKYVPKKQCYWSKSYYDPYSFEPMVTCTIPMSRSGSDFYGVATTDIKLSGLTQIINQTTHNMQGYAFVVDRNNKFLSYPDLSKAKLVLTDQLGKKSEDFLNVTQFSKKFPEFNQIAIQLENINKKIIQSMESDLAVVEQLAENLAHNSYQISQAEAVLLAAILLKNNIDKKSKENYFSFKAEDDVLLNEPVLINTFLLPDTYWKLVLVTPESAFAQKIDTAINGILLYLLSLIIFIFLLGHWLIGRVVIKPFNQLVSQLCSNSETPLDDSSVNEFGLVAKSINEKTKQLRDSNKKMAIAMDKRERADRLRRVSEKRFRAIAKTAPDAIISIDINGEIIDWNPAASRIFGYQKKDIIGKKYTRLLVPGALNIAIKEVENYLSGNIKTLDKSQVQLQAIRSDGFIFTAEFSITSWTEAEKRFFSIFLRDISRRIESEHQLRHQALHDPLTQLPNRSLFKDRLMSAVLQAKRSRLNIAVMIIDLDDFKVINDTLGHGIGDKLLQVIAKRVIDKKRATDTVARLGGDEFGVVQTNISEPADAMLFASKLRKVIAQPMTIEGNTFQVGCSIGITVYPNDSVKPDNLLRNADIAMYRAKEEGRNSVRFFVEEMDMAIQKRKEILEDIFVAIEKNQFQLYLQPLINLKNNQTVGAEALIRWQHPEKGFISPGDFIPIAEQSNAINDIGQWVVKDVCRMINEMDRLGLPKFTIALNISPAQFKRENIYESMIQVLKQENVDPNRVECEITESAIMENVERVIQIMYSLRRVGFKLAIDDFGTGYSSLSYLKRFPINKIKIDRSFIADIETDEDSASIAQSIIQLGHSMNLTVLAEGVETEGQQQWLIDHECDLLQGFYRARPMAFDSFIEWVKGS